MFVSVTMSSMKPEGTISDNSQKRSGRGCWFVIIVIVVLFALSSPLILRGIGAALIYADPLEKAGLAVALSGDEGDRISEAAELMRNHYVDGIIITYTDEATYDQLISEAGKKDISPDRIYVTYTMVSNTVDEARAVLDLAANRAQDSLIIITDPFHTLRTRIIFRDIFQGSGISIQVRPVPDHWYQADSWWKTAEGVSLTFQEYLKILFYRFEKY